MHALLERIGKPLHFNIMKYIHFYKVRIRILITVETCCMNGVSVIFVYFSILGSLSAINILKSDVFSLKRYIFGFLESIQGSSGMRARSPIIATCHVTYFARVSYINDFFTYATNTSEV